MKIAVNSKLLVTVLLVIVILTYGVFWFQQNKLLLLEAENHKRDIADRNAIVLQQQANLPETNASINSSSTLSSQSNSVNMQNFGLIGTIQGEHQFAMIRKNKTLEERLFKKGERVYDCGVLIAVRNDSVDIRTETGIFRLDLHSRAVTDLSPTYNTSNTAQKNDGIITDKSSTSLLNSSYTLTQEENATNTHLTIKQLFKGPTVVTQNLINNLFNQHGQSDSNTQLTQVKVGEASGLRLSRLSPDGVVGTLGFMNGDVIMKINNVQIDTPGKAESSLRSITKQQKTSIELIRNNEPLTLNFDIH